MQTGLNLFETMQQSKEEEEEEVDEKEGINLEDKSMKLKQSLANNYVIQYLLMIYFLIAK